MSLNISHPLIIGKLIKLEGQYFSACSHRLEEDEWIDVAREKLSS